MAQPEIKEEDRTQGMVESLTTAFDALLEIKKLNGGGIYGQLADKAIQQMIKRLAE